MRHFLKFAVRRQIVDVVAAIMQIVAAVPHRAQRRLPAGVPERATDFLGLKAAGAELSPHCSSTPPGNIQANRISG